MRTRTGGTTNWGLSFSYDVYGNRTAQTVTAGTAPAFSAQFDNNNRMTVPATSYDANGNQLYTPDGAALDYDADNRLNTWSRSGATEGYQYHPAGWRVWKVSSHASTLYLYGPGGQLLTDDSGNDHIYFAGRLLYTGNPATTVYTDRLGSVRATETWAYGYTSTRRSYYPFGEEIGTTANDQFKFASTYRDSTTGLDYAMNRYYASGTGRFLTPDPYSGSAGPSSPQSWNRYNYTLNDPVNASDPSGLDMYSYYSPPSSPAPSGRGGGVGGTDGSQDMAVVNDGDASPKEESGVSPYRSECDRTDPTNKRALDFIDAHRADAAKIGAAAGISAQFALAVAAEETLYGTQGIVVAPGNTNNYFGLHVGGENDTSRYANQTDTYHATQDGWVAKFSGTSGFLDSGMGFASLMKGGVKGMTDPAKFAAYLHHHGYGTPNSGYEGDLRSVIGRISRSWDCPK